MRAVLVSTHSAWRVTGANVEGGLFRYAPDLICGAMEARHDVNRNLKQSTSLNCLCTVKVGTSSSTSGGSQGLGSIHDGATGPVLAANHRTSY